jgi:subtilisin-like proprotein convertase family protein
VYIRSTTPNSTYSTYSGTSMAAPHVAGAIALYWGANPTLTYQQVIAKLKSSVDVLPDLNGKVGTSGRLNVAMMFATSPPTVPPAIAPGPKVTAATFAATPNVQFNGVRVVFDRAINPATFTASDVALTGPNGAITGFSITPVAGTTTRFDIGFVGRTAGTYSITIGPDVRDTLGNPMNQDGDAVAGEVTGDRFFASATLVTTVTRTFATPALSLAINDLATTVSTIAVTDDLKISDLNARVSLTHTYDSDLVVTLTAPTVNGVAGKTVTLFNRRGGSGDNLTNTGFDDEAVTAIAGGAAPFNGTFRPDGLLSAFDGLSTKGVWTLRVTDNATFDVGRLTGWSFTVSGTVGAGAASVRSFGFRDEPTAFDDSALEALVEPVAVDSAAPSEDTSAEPATADDSTTGSASVVFVWTDADRDQRESDAPQVVVRDGAERENRPAPIDGSVPAPPDVPSELLYLAPDESTESEEDVFEVFAVK